MTLRTCLLTLTCAAALAVPAALAPAAPARAATDMKAVLEAEIVTLDPHATGAYITRTFGFMVFDMLFAMDSKGEIKPQMVDSWTTSDDGLTWTFTLRDGLKFHDGAPVSGADVAASITRWMPQSMMGKLLKEAGGVVEGGDGNTFTITVTTPFPLMTTVLGHTSSPSPFIMPARLAATPIGQPLPEIVGSGPFVYDPAKHQPGASMTLTRFADYVPRDEPADFLAGGKVVNVDELTIDVIPDALTATSALNAGDIDYMQYLPFDMLPMEEADPNVEVMNFHGGNMFMGYYPINFRNPPFDNPKIRQVLYSFVDQTSVLAAMGLSEQYTVPDCQSWFMCGMPYETTAGSLFPEKVSIEAGKEALAASGYKGEEIVILQATDLEAARVSSAVLYEWMRQVGFNVKLEAMDWASLLSTRKDEKAWHIYGIHSLGVDLGNPMTNFMTARNCMPMPGWYCDDAIGKALDGFRTADGADAQKAAADEVSRAVYAANTGLMWGQFAQPAGLKAGVTDMIPSAIPVFWNVKLPE
ncbi:ABC transporter substrate-binding protein [Frigidibacter sp. MR17.24]|uniref:ABC transporter substrate-binding protein n=1 Tax=Frigidibacter sp. MR17.24 TaxID=3127345 RepID=UPI003012E784